MRKQGCSQKDAVWFKPKYLSGDQDVCAYPEGNQHWSSVAESEEQNLCDLRLQLPKIRQTRIQIPHVTSSLCELTCGLTFPTSPHSDG